MYGYLDIKSEIELLIIVWGLITTDLFWPKSSDHLEFHLRIAYALVFNCIFYFPYILDLKASYMVDRFTEISPISAMI